MLTIDKTLKAKHNEEELESARTKISSLQIELTEQNEQLETMQQRAENAETTLIEHQKALDQEKQAWKSEMQQRLDEDRIKWREDHLGHPQLCLSRTESPAPSSHRNLTADLLGLQNLQTKASSRSFVNEVPQLENRMGRKSSAQRVRSSGHATPQRQDSAYSCSQWGCIGGAFDSCNRLR